MSRQKQSLLLVDNVQSYLDVQAQSLIEEGYRVFKAESIDRANQLLQEKRVHLVISDIRMEDETHPEDVSGLLWAQNKKYRSIPKIILTAYPKDHISEALKLILDERANIVDFVTKPDGPEVLHRAISKAFSEKIKINWELIIRWNPTYSPNHLISLIQPSTDPFLFEERAKEIEDLIRQLFYNFKQVTLGRILSTLPGHVILEVFAYNALDKETQYVISIGRRSLVVNERKRSESLPTGKGIGSTRWARELSFVKTLRFAISGYNLVEGDLEAMTSFSTFYRYNNTQASIQALDHLYHVTLAAWHEGGLSQKEYTLPDFVTSMSFDTTKFDDLLETKIEALCKQAMSAGVALLNCTAGRLSLQIAGDSPISYQLPTHHRLISLPPQQVLCGIVHGCVDGHSVRVGLDGTTWLINFSQAGDGVLLRDFARLENHIKFAWLRSVSVADRYLLEQRLISRKKPEESEEKEDLPVNMAKAFVIITYLRRLATHNLDPNLKPYLLGLCAYTLSYFSTFDPAIRYRRGELESYAHSLLSLVMLCDNLAVQSESGRQLPMEAHHGLWLDMQDKCVWVKGEKIDLTPQEYALLDFLYQNKNQLCARDDIARHVWSDAQEPVWSKNTLDTLIGRVRYKIEVTSKNPKYLITVRGRGFKLNI
ncbi:MAG: hypothetical protein CL608_28690 [Anaerolineaceae bacterium]|nr:hypothetical protein [Anaerolineaceae bacterium]